MLSSSINLPHLVACLFANVFKKVCGSKQRFTNKGKIRENLKITLKNTAVKA